MQMINDNEGKSLKTIRKKSRNESHCNRSLDCDNRCQRWHHRLSKIQSGGSQFDDSARQSSLREASSMILLGSLAFSYVIQRPPRCSKFTVKSSPVLTNSAQNKTFATICQADAVPQTGQQTSLFSNK